jgi:hypothetical protein
MTKENRIWTLRQFCAYYAWPTIAGMRWIVFNKHTNGYRDAFLKCGKTVLVDVDRFWEILREKQNKKEE